MTAVDRLARHARLYGSEGVFSAALDLIEGPELARLAAILRRNGWRPTKAEQAQIEKARATAATNGSGPTLPPILEMDATSGCRALSPHGERVLSVADSDRDLGDSANGHRPQRAVCAVCGRSFRARRSTAKFCSSTCRSTAHRRAA